YQILSYSFMCAKIQLLSVDFDGTLVSRAGEPVPDIQCMELIRELQEGGAIWAINTGRSVDLLESGLADFSFPIRPASILTTDHHRGAALGELSRLIDVPREKIFTSGDHHNDVSMLDGQFAALASCPANAIQEVKDAVRAAGGYVAQNEYGAGVHEALVHFLNGSR